MIVGRGQLAFAFALCVLVGLVLGGGPFSSGKGDLGPQASTAADHPFAVAREPRPEPAPKRLPGYPVAHVAHSAVLYDRPAGKPRVRIAAKTQFGSPRTLGVVRRKGIWLAVLVPELKNGQVGWIRADHVTRQSRVAWSLHADLSRRVLRIKRHGKIVRSVRIGIGQPGHPTPVGRYAVTDTLLPTDLSSAYGCCVLALTGHQTNLPAGWPGGDRLALHATNNLGSVGESASLGCMRMYPEDIRWLVRRIPLGSPVFVHR